MEAQQVVVERVLVTAQPMTLLPLMPLLLAQAAVAAVFNQWVVTVATATAVLWL